MFKLNKIISYIIIYLFIIIYIIYSIYYNNNYLILYDFNFAYDHLIYIQIITEQIKDITNNEII